MRERGNRSAGRGRGGRGGRRGNNYNRPTSTSKGQCSDLGNHVFDYGHNAAADQMRTTWDKIVLHVCIEYGSDISTELRTRQTRIISPPEHTKQVLEDHAEKEQERKAHYQELKALLEPHLAQLQKEKKPTVDISLKICGVDG